MLRLVNVVKSYKNGESKKVILDNINIDFKKGECVFILGKSGSGKSTLLNIIASLISVDSGNIFLDSDDITKFGYKDLCNYRNNMIGYIYQDYHLIEYMSILDNIKLGCTISNSNSNKNIDLILKKLGLYDKRNVLVNKLSGGEKQRVAIARVLINDPEIILCDEPTGSLDSFNSRMIMEILKELSLDKLVIVVSHDEDSAIKYADRIIRINDGKVDYKPIYDLVKFRGIRNNKIRFGSILRLAISNLRLKKGRMLFTSIALSLGFMSLLLVLSLSNSFSNVIRNTEEDIVSIVPISVSNLEYVLDNDVIKSNDKIIYRDEDRYVHRNKITSNYIDYIKNINEISYIGYVYDISFPLISDSYYEIDNMYMRVMPSSKYIDNNYDILYGDNITKYNDVLLKVDSNNNVSSNILSLFNIDGDIMYKELVGRSIRVILNDDYYVKDGSYYYINDDIKGMYDNSLIVLNIVGIVREKEIVDDNSYFYYSNDLINYVIDKNKNSKIVLEQLNSDKVLINNYDEKDSLLSYLGYNTLPSVIDIYVSNLVNKKLVIEKLDEYNNMNEDIIYVDNVSDMIKVVEDMINVISIVLVMFSFISIGISSLMIFILTSNRVLDSVREIGILGCLGASKKDIKRLFNLENKIIGIMSLGIGTIFIYMLKSPINYILGMLLGEYNIFNIDYVLLMGVGVFSILMVIISGYIPIVRASNRNIIDCIYRR